MGMSPPAHPAPTDPERLKLLYDLACAFATRLELDDLITLVVEKCQDVFAAEGASVLLHDREQAELYPSLIHL